MGKKPVLGLVGLCVGLALTGCKNCGCGWTQKNQKPDHGHAVSRVQKDEKYKPEGDSWGQDARKRSTPDRTVAGKGSEGVHTKHPYDFKDKYNPPVEQPTEPFVTSGSKRTTQPNVPYDAAGIGPQKDVEQPASFTETNQTAKKPTYAIPPETPTSPARDAALNHGIAQPVPPGMPAVETIPAPEPEREPEVPKELKDKVLQHPRPLHREVAPTNEPSLPSLPEPVKKSDAGSVPPPAPVPGAEGPPLSGSDLSTPSAPESKKATPATEEIKGDLDLGPPPPPPPPPPPSE